MMLYGGKEIGFGIYDAPYSPLGCFYFNKKKEEEKNSLSGLM